MSARRPRRHFGEEPEKDMGERWMASYMDMVTVLMCLFIVLFAMSTVDEGKYEELRNSLAEGFGVAHVVTSETSTGIIVPPDMLDEKQAGSTNLELAALEVDDLTSLREKIRESLQKKGLAAAVKFELDQRGLTIRLIGTETFFETNRASLSGEAGRCSTRSARFSPSPDTSDSVEGHADIRQASSPYATNWELSAARATAVLRHLVEVNAVSCRTSGLRRLRFGAADRRGRIARRPGHEPPRGRRCALRSAGQDPLLDRRRARDRQEDGNGPCDRLSRSTRVSLPDHVACR